MSLLRGARGTRPPSLRYGGRVLRARALVRTRAYVVTARARTPALKRNVHAYGHAGARVIVTHMTAHIHVVTPSVLENWERLVYPRWELKMRSQRDSGLILSDDPCEIWIHVYVGYMAEDEPWAPQWLQFVELFDHDGARDRSFDGAYGWMSMTWCWHP